MLLKLHKREAHSGKIPAYLSATLKNGKRSEPATAICPAKVNKTNPLR